MPVYLVTVSHGPRTQGQVIQTDVDQSILVKRGYLREIPKEVVDEYMGEDPVGSVLPDPVPESAAARVRRGRPKRKEIVEPEVTDEPLGAEPGSDPRDVEERGISTGEPVLE